MIILLNILFGAAMLLLGRKLFWFFVGAMGFITVTSYAVHSMQGMPNWMILAVALLAGLVGALLALFVRVVGIGLAGFLGGGFLAVAAATALGFSGGRLDVIIYLVGAVLGAILFYALFNWALVILSAVSGAFILAQNTPTPARWFWFVVVGLAIIGIAVQAQQMEEED